MQKIISPCRLAASKYNSIMSRGENSDSIPTDLIPEICSRLPAKYVARFCCVSKLWGSMLHRSYFKELFFTRSCARPCLLFAVKQQGLRRWFDDEWSFFSSPQLQNQYGESSPVVSASFHMKFAKQVPVSFCSLASGLILFTSMRISKKKGELGAVPVIFNLRTRQYASLPVASGYKKNYLLGFDPIDKQFKVLSVSGDDYRVLTLGTGEMRWRKIQCPFIPSHFYIENLFYNISINGVLYSLSSLGIVCFDVRSEKFKFIDFELPWGIPYLKLVNYKGRLGVIRKEYGGDGNAFHKLSVSVLEDVEKPEWSKHVYTLPKNGVFDLRNVSIAGVTATGEIVLSNKYTSSKPFYVFYFNPERNTLQSVEIQGFGEYYEALDKRIHRVYAFVDHVDDLDVNDAKYLKSSEGLDIIKKVQKPPILCHSDLSLKNKYDLLGEQD